MKKKEKNALFGIVLKSNKKVNLETETKLK